MKRGLSIYLDLFRFNAALVVLVSHAFIDHLGGDWLKMTRYGQEAVQGFFVLSGFVIAFVAATKEHDPVAFGAARLARLWSVLLPALLLTPFMDMIGHWFSPAPYEGWGDNMGFDNPLLRLSAAAVFMNELWLSSMSPLSNIPVWSLGFEAWYYALFGAFIFTRGHQRIWLVGVFGLIAGPKILILMPSWILGAWLYNRRDAIAFSRPVAVGFFIAGPLLILAGRTFHLQPYLLSLEQSVFDQDLIDKSLKFADSFIWQNLVGVFICIHLAGAIALAKDLERSLAAAERAIRTCASYSYSIYLFHFPLQLMIAAALHNQGDGPLKTAAVILGSLTLSWGLGAIFAPMHPRLRTSLLLAAGRIFVNAPRNVEPVET